MNVNNMPTVDLVLVCQQQTESDSMVLFLRAITAAAFVKTSDDSELLMILECMTDSAG